MLLLWTDSLHLILCGRIGNQDHLLIYQRLHNEGLFRAQVELTIKAFWKFNIVKYVFAREECRRLTNGCKNP